MERVPPPLIPAIQNARRKTFAKGQVMFYQGDRTPHAFIVHSGVVKIYDIDEQGNEKILQLVSQSAVIPFAFFSGSAVPSNWYYQALTDCEVYEVSQIKMLQSMLDDSNLALYLMHWFSSETHDILLRLSSLGKSSARDKLLAALRSLASRNSLGRPGGWHRVVFPVNHQLLADMAGITRESAAVAMKNLQDEGIIRHPRPAMLEVNFSKLV